MAILRNNIIITPLISYGKVNQTRNFWEYVNMMFNKPDQDRINLLGPDRACAEWVLRNGGQVVWADGKKISDYNKLPSENQSVPKLVEIDGTDSSISHYGFSHIDGCEMLKKITLHNSKYIDDRALKGLFHGKGTLEHLQVSKCPNVTDAGLKELSILSKLKLLILFDLIGVENLTECLAHVRSHLPSCEVKGKPDLNEMST